MWRKQKMTERNRESVHSEINEEREIQHSWSNNLQLSEKQKELEQPTQE